MSTSGSTKRRRVASPTSSTTTSRRGNATGSTNPAETGDGPVEISRAEPSGAPSQQERPFLQCDACSRAIFKSVHSNFVQLDPCKHRICTGCALTALGKRGVSQLCCPCGDCGQDVDAHQHLGFRLGRDSSLVLDDDEPVVQHEWRSSALPTKQKDPYPATPHTAPRRLCPPTMSAIDQNLSARKRSRFPRTAEADADDTPASRCSSDGTGLPAAIARVLVENGFLGAGDLGLRIGPLNRSLRETALDDDLWLCLCRRRYPNTAAVPRALIERRGGYRGWYRMRQAFIDGPPQPPHMQEDLPPPDTKREDYMLLVDLFYCEKSVLSLVVKGDDLGPFLEEGRVRLDLDEPLTLGTSLPSWPPPEDEGTDANIDDEEEDLCYSLDSYRLETVEYSHFKKNRALVHLVRISDDAVDKDSILQVAPHVTDLFQHLFQAEARSSPEMYMDQQANINDKMRAIVVDWLVEVHMGYRLVPATLYLCINLIDRYCSHVSVARSKLQLVGITALLIARKYEEIHPPEVQECVYITDRAYQRQEVLDMEQDILQRLRFKITVPTGYPFLLRFLNVVKASSLARVAANYYMERTLQEHDLLRFKPSVVAASAVILALNNPDICEDSDCPGLPQILTEYTGFLRSEIMACSALIATKVGEETVTASRRHLVAVKRKYDHRQYQNVSTAVQQPKVDNIMRAGDTGDCV